MDCKGSIGILALLSCIVGSVFSGDIPNVTQVPGTLLNGPIAPEQGRTAIVAFHGGRIISVPEPPGSQPGADLRVRIVDISNPQTPVITVMPFQSGGFNSHGYFQYGRYLFIGYHETSPGSGVYRDSFYMNSTGNFTERSIEADGGLPLGTYMRTGAQSPWGAQMFWSYGDVGGNAFLAIRRSLAEYTHDWNNGGAPTGPAVKSTFDLLGTTGVVGMPFIIGNILIYASDQTGTGVATYDISNPANPILLDVLKDQNPGGYWPEIYGHYIFFPRRDGEGGAGSLAGFMVVDFEDPTNLRVVANRNLTGSNQYVTFQDEYAFMNKYKIDMRTFDTVLTLPTNDTTLDASQFALPVGNLVVTGGYGSLGPGLAIWAHQAAPDTRGPFVAYHVPKADQTNYSTLCPITLSIPETLRTETIVNGTTLIVRPVGGSAINCWHSFGQNKLLTVTPVAPLLPNTTYEVLLTSGIQDACGNGMEPYSFRFSTGSGVTGGNRPPAATVLTANPNPANVNTNISFSATASDPDGDAIEYRFDFGDGSAKTAWSATSSTSHTYTAARHYQVTVQVRDPSGALSSFSRKVTVSNPPAGPAPVNSSSIVVGAAARRVWNVNPDTNTLTAVNADTLAKVWEMPTGADPRSVTLAGDGTLWVACHDADRVDVLDGTSGALITSIATGYGSAPVGVCASPNGTSVYASCMGDGTFRRFDVASRSQNASLSVGPMPRAIAITGDGNRALVTRFISGENSGSVYDVNLSNMSLTRTIGLARHYVADGSASGRGVPNYLAGITIAPGNTRAWVVGKKDNTERGTFISSTTLLGQDTTVRAQVVVIDLGTNAEDDTLRMDIDNSDSPTSVAFSALGDYAFVTLQGNNQVAVVDYLEYVNPVSAKGAMTRLGTGLAPQGLAVDASTGRVFAQNFMGRSITSLEVSALLSSGSLNLPGTEVSTVATEVLAPAVLRGKQIFYNAADTRMSAEGYISCATCHVDGSHDGRTFDFTQRGEGFRNTTDLRGRLGTGHGAVHWTANFDEIQDFENDIRGAFGGKGFMTDADFAATTNPLGVPKAGRSSSLDDLSAYVSSLGGSSIPRSPNRQADGSLGAAAANGMAVFQRENCASCHVPSAGFTDRQRHNVGTLRSSSGSRIGGPLDGIDTPTLLGLHASAPYFHDGSAKTLAEVFTIAGGDLRQAESGTVANGAATDTVDWQPTKNWHGGSMVVLDNNNEQVTFNNIDGGPGGNGMLELRYAASYGVNVNLTVIVNGNTLPNQVLSLTPNNPAYLPNEWRIHRVFSVPFTAGATNTVILRRGNGGVLWIDDVLFSTPAIDQLAAAHRRGISAQDVSDLTAYLSQLDVNDQPAPAQLSSLQATPNPAAPGAIVFYSVNATGAQPLTYEWNFGDGGSSTSANPGHIYSALGTYTTTVIVTDLLGQISVMTVDVVVSTDGGLGTGGNGSAEFPFLLPVVKLQGKAKPSSTKDQCSVSGTFPNIPAQFDPSGKTLVLTIGSGATNTFTFDAKGKAKNNNGTAMLKLKPSVKDPVTKKPKFAGGDMAFKATIKNGSWLTSWTTAGAVLSGDAKKQAVSVPVTAQFNGANYAASVQALYTGKTGKGGMFKK